MYGLKHLTIVSARDNEKILVDFLHSKGVKTVLCKFCFGTATKSVLDVLGLEDTERIMLDCVVPISKVTEIKNALSYELNFARGLGVAYFSSVDSLGGEYAKNYFTDEPISKGENKMEQTKFVLIMAIVNKGNVDDVMDSAREVGASGGTVVKAKGTGTEIAKFFGINICEEKEIIHIVAKREKRDDIMRAIMAKAGKDTEAQGVVFALPVEEVVGIKSFEN